MPLQHERSPTGRLAGGENRNLPAPAQRFAVYSAGPCRRDRGQNSPEHTWRTVGRVHHPPNPSGCRATVARLPIASRSALYGFRDPEQGGRLTPPSYPISSSTICVDEHNEYIPGVSPPDCRGLGEPVEPTSARLGTVDSSGEGVPMMWEDPITENPALGATEIWEMRPRAVRETTGSPGDRVFGADESAKLGYVGSRNQEVRPPWLRAEMAPSRFDGRVQ